MPASSIAWLDIPARHAAAAKRFHEAALKAHLPPAQAVAMTSTLFLTQPSTSAPAFASRWMRADRSRLGQNTRAA